MKRPKSIQAMAVAALAFAALCASLPGGPSAAANEPAGSAGGQDQTGLNRPLEPSGEVHEPDGSAAAGKIAPQPPAKAPGKDETKAMEAYYKEWRSRLEEVLDGMAYGESAIGEAEEENFDYIGCETAQTGCQHRLKARLVPFEKAMGIVAGKSYPRDGLVTIQMFEAAGDEKARQEAAALIAKLNDQAETGNFYIAAAAARAAEIQKRYAGIRSYHVVENFKAEKCSELLALLSSLREDHLVKLKNAVARHKQYWMLLKPYMKQGGQEPQFTGPASLAP